MPLAEDRLIVPRACVAEVVRFTAPEQEAGAHNWMLGTVNWNGRALPVVGRLRSPCCASELVTFSSP